jgi:hypothetical protein
MLLKKSFEDLKEHLKNIYKEISEGNIPNVRKAAEFELT